MAQGGDNDNGNKGVELDSTLVTKAVHALLKHHESKTSNELLGNESNIHLLISLVVPPKVPSGKHHEIVLPHALYKDLADAEVCLIVKNDATKKDIQELQTQFPDLLKPVKKILTLDSLRSKHGDYAQRRSLMKRFTQFLVDDRITPLMPRALGRDFMKKHKLPLSIKIATGSGQGTNVNLATALQRGVRSTYYTVNAGSCVSVKVAVTTMTATAVVDNIVTASKSLHFTTKSIQNICIKSPESAALPIFNQTPEQLYDVIALAREEAAKQAEEEKAKSDLLAEVAAATSKPTKSPLLKALKKQKKIEKDEAKQPTKESKSLNDKEKAKDAKTDNAKDKAKEKKNKDVKDAMEVEKDDEEAKQSKKKRPNKSADSTDAKKTKNDKSNDAPVPAVKNDGESAEKQKESKQKIKQGDAEKSSSGKKDKTPGKVEVDSKQTKGKDDSSKKRGKDSADSPSPAKKNKIDDSKAENVEFLAAAKFTESKKGYVFKKGPKGLGYYLDKKPVVNKMAMDALRRSSQSPRGSSKPRSHSKNSSKRRR